jgi:hypothetical protein
MITNSFLPSERYLCRAGLLERLALHTPYPAIAARIIDIVGRLPRYTTVIVDRTGAHAAYDMLVEKGLRFLADRAAKKWPLRGSLKLGVERL